MVLYIDAILGLPYPIVLRGFETGIKEQRVMVQF